MPSENAGDEAPECDFCDRDAVALYEGGIPPAGTLRRPLCSGHAPNVQPVKWYADRLVTDGGESLGDGVSQDRAQTETAPWIVALGAVLGLAMLFVAIQGGAL